MGKARDPVLVCVRGTANQIEFVEHRYYGHFARTCKSVTYAGWLSFWVRKVVEFKLKATHFFNKFDTSNQFWVILSYFLLERPEQNQMSQSRSRYGE